MVVTCPSCSARYRLNPSKMKGRGAKITCPKCSHVFVIFADGASGSASDAASDTDAMEVQQEDTLRERLLRRDRSTTSSAMEAIGLGEEVDTSLTSNKIRVVAPGPRGKRKAVATLDTAQSIPKLSAMEADAAEEDSEAWDGPEILDANQLDFREVGISTWKVKVAIGLVYDFSDIATLKRYLEDKRVTASDLISHDGKDWTTIGDIPDLDQHFIDTWKRARVGRKDRTAPKKAPVQPEGATETGSFATSTGRMGALSPSGQHATIRSKARRRSKNKVEEQKTSGLLSRKGAFVAALVVLGLVVAWRFVAPAPSQQPGGGGAAPAATTLESQVEEADEQDRIRQKVREEVQRKAREMIKEERDAIAVQEDSEEASRSGEVDLSRLEAVRPAEQQTQASAPVQAPAERRAPPTPGKTLRPPPSRNPSPRATTSVRRDQGGALWLQKGKEAFASGNYGSAKAMFQQCVNKNPQSGECWEGLGKSLQVLGDSKGAADAFARAGELGVQVNRAAP
ncbi:MAG: zinc-ribbon domain-containing protein [Myxococcota bacterium]|nr:zinc-ribbon domain-containing protein [Myxococcota bacterium]